MRFILFCVFVLGLAGCATVPPKTLPDRLTLTPVSFDDLAGWDKDTPKDALAAFRHSCTQLVAKPADSSLGIAGKIAAWRWACAAAQNVDDTDDAARDYFHVWFRPYATSGRDGVEGLFTGYYVPELHGSLQRGGAYQTPLYARPHDLISVDLGLFKDEWKGQHIVGKVADTKFIPYDERKAIAKGSLENRADVLVWVDDPIGAFFLEVQGSGRVRLPDGSVMTIGFDGVNGHGYVAIGRIMAERGDIARPVTMPAIRTWLAAHPDKAQDALNINPSYVFFRRLPGDDVVGAEGVNLTPLRSLAVDPAFVPLGVPVWLDTVDGHGAPLQRLMVAQDTGGAIKGAVRGDVFWGAGDDAAAQAGMMQGHGRYYLLLPKTVDPNDD
jgi:membrane-bound lytic murein transglycosylase A